MNIFLIPSWYPSQDKPNSGRFIKEQALALSRFNQNIKVVVSLWGDEATKINFEHPWQVLSHLINHFSNEGYQKRIARNVWEFSRPALEWSPRILAGNIRKIIKSNKINFERASSNIGEIDLIHAHVAFPAGYVAMKLAEEYHLPFIITEHMGPFPLPPFAGGQKLLPLVLRPLKKANRVIAVSSKLQRELLQYKIKSVVVSNLVDERYFTHQRQKSRPKFTFFTLGEISEAKGFEDLIKAIAIAGKRKRNIIWRIGGQGKELKQYQKLAALLGVSQNINWLGFLSRSSVAEELQRCNAFVLPSHHESFGMVFLEALACGRPVVATRCGGPEDFVTRKNGLLVPVGDIQNISQAMTKMVENINFYQSSKIRQYFLANFSAKVIASKIVKIYEEICVG